MSLFTKEFHFELRQPTTWWQGRYNRVNGSGSMFHVKVNGEVFCQENDGLDKMTCIGVVTQSLQYLGQVINSLKSQLTGKAGGLFAINEYGQVICPVSNHDARVYVGDSSGAIDFVKPDGQVFTLNDDAGLKNGDRWNHPYVGMQYNLSRFDRVYIQSRTGNDTALEFCPKVDKAIISALRKLRPYGPVRFVVNPHGIVLTKVPPHWFVTYVGRINYDLWFLKQVA